MDKQDTTMRRYLGERANLVGAIRLPNTAFKANAGTDGTTDILILQKRHSDTLATGEPWCDLAMHETAEHGQLHINEYFAKNPHMRLGRMVVEGGMYRSNDPALAGELTPDLLATAISSLPVGIMFPRPRSQIEPTFESADLSGVKEGAFAFRGGQLLIRNGSRFDPAGFSATVTARVRGMMAIRDAVRAVFQSQLDDGSDDHITEARKELNKVYDDFLWQHGPLSSSENIKAFANDPDHRILLS
jgi:hypothetical protein